MSINRINISRMIGINNNWYEKMSKRWSASFLGYCLFAIIALYSSGASAADPALVHVSSAYFNCSYEDTSKDYVTMKLSIAFNAVNTHTTNDKPFLSRGIVIYTYDGNGVLQNSNGVVSYVRFNDMNNTGSHEGNGYLMFTGVGTNNVLNDTWVGRLNLFANIYLVVYKSKISGWPAVAVRSANFTSGGDFLQVTGAAYIGPETKGGNCSQISTPETPPPAVTPKVTMSAPDWDLGELPAGEETVLTLPATKDQLCFNYEGLTAITSQKYLINATNTNGLSANGRYLLKSLEDSSQTVPYTLTLANSTDSVLLPNTQNRLFSLDAGGRTCFTPTFKAKPDKTVKSGAYSDILTFTVVTKP